MVPQHGRAGGSAAKMFRRAIVAFWILSVTPAPLAHAQLSNAGFEQSGSALSGWTTFNNAVPNVTVSTTTPRSGSRCAKVFGGFNGDPNYSGFFQNVSASGGQLWQANGHFRHNGGDALAGTQNRALLKVEFYRVQNGAYGSPDMLLETQLEVLNAASPQNLWIAATHTAIAPPSTIEARLVVVFEQRGGGGGSCLIDDMAFSPSTPPPDITWQMIWNDEFDGPTVDGSKWRVEDLHLIKNNELQYYAPDEVYQQSGCVTLRSRQRSYWGFDSNGNWGHYDYTSGLIESKDRFATAYGRIEVRAKLPATRGIWPAHWMLPDSRQWPPEIDIMELLGHEPTRVYMTHHWGSWPQVQHNGGSYGGPNFAADFHTYAVEWTPARIDWKVDGALRFTSGNNIPREPFYIILNTAVGGDWPGNPDGTTVFPQYHDIDYVRVYVPADPNPPLLNLIDTTAGTADVNGEIGGNEYTGSADGINNGLQDRIGRFSTLHLDSSSDGRLSLGFESVTAWSASGAYGVVAYVDSIPGGYASTYDMDDVATRARRLASGKGSGGSPRSDLYFAPGFLADFAVVFEPGAVSIFQLGSAAQSLVNGATLGAATDIFGGTQVRYRIDDGSFGGRMRECELQLAHLGLSPGGSMRMFCTLMNGDSAFRANEFIGVAIGNAWDGVNPGSNAVALKPGDFINFVSIASTTCGAGCSAAGGDGDIDGDCDVDLADLSALLGHFGAQSGALHAEGDVDFDGDIELDDLTKLLGVFGAVCP